MRKAIVWIVVIVVAVALGIGAAVVVGGFISSATARGILPGSNQSSQGQLYTGCWQMGPEMMGSVYGSPSNTGNRISIDAAVTLSKQYVAKCGSNLSVSEIMEFSNNFYVVVKETKTDRGAFELLVDPYTGAVYPEPGPNMMWNYKYSPMNQMMGYYQGGDNTISLDQAAQYGQKYLDTNITGAKLESDGISYYGHYTFDYQINNTIAGMLSVNGQTGEIWLHTWHGDFIQELKVK